MFIQQVRLGILLEELNSTMEQNRKQMIQYEVVRRIESITRFLILFLSMLGLLLFQFKSEINIIFNFITILSIASLILGATKRYIIEYGCIELLEILIPDFPEEARAEFFALRERLVNERKSTRQIYAILCYEGFKLLWAFCIQIKIENLWLPSHDRRIDD